MTLLIALLMAVAAGLAAWAVLGLVLHRRRRGLESALAPYTIGRLTEADARPSGGGTQDLVEVPMVKRMVAAVADVATRRGILQVVEGWLEQADLPLRPAEVLFIYLSAVVLGGLLGGLLVGAVWGLVVAGVQALVPWVVLNH